MLHREEIETTWSVEAVAEHIGEFRAAWRQRLPQFPCPWKFEDGKKWLRSAESTRGQEVWVKYYGPGIAPEIWPLIEAEALGKEVQQTEDTADISAVVFREDETGNCYTEPL